VWPSVLLKVDLHNLEKTKAHDKDCRKAQVSKNEQKCTAYILAYGVLYATRK
jgi:hypothetical protein